MWRLHSWLLVHAAPIDGRRQLVAQASSDRPPLIIRHPLALAALAALPPEFDPSCAFDAWRDVGISDEAAPALWSALVDANLITEADRRPSWWDELRWREAGTYHEATRDYPFEQMDLPDAFARGTELMEEYRRQTPAPSPYQRAGDDRTVALARLDLDGSADERLARMPPRERRGRQGISMLLGVCFGERGQIAVAGGLSCLLKSIPSGGARHPTEVFLAAFELDGIPEGVYHYDVEHHCLRNVRTGQYRGALANATYDLFDKHPTPPVAALVFTSRVERAMWRYRDPRSFRAILVDVGHAVAAYRGVARMLGFRTYAMQKVRDSEVANLVAVDRFAQPPLYVGTLV